MSMHAVGSTAQVRLGAVVVPRMQFGPPPLRFFAGSLAMLVFAVVVGGLGGFMAEQGAPLAVGAGGLVLGAGLLVAGVAGLLRRTSLRYALTVHEQGVLVSHKGVEQPISYMQVQGFSLEEKEQLDNGKHAGTLRTLRFALQDGESRIVHFANTQTEESFGAVVEQLLGKLADAAQARLGTGASLTGKGWTLDSHGLHVAGQAPLRLSELASVGLFEGRVSFWRTGEELPFFSVPAASHNARLLGVMAQRQLSGRERPTAGVLGRILFQKSAGPIMRGFSWFLAATCLLTGGGLLTLGVPGNWPGIAGAVAFAWGMAWLFANMAISRFRVHERGVTKRSLLGSRLLRYEELLSFQFGAVRHYHNGAYTGTRLSLRFTPGPGAKPINHSQLTRGSDADMDLLREQVSGMVAAQLLERLKRGEEVSWGPTARFTKAGLVVHASKLFGQGESRLAPYDAGLRVSIDQGRCHLFIGSEPKAAMSVACSADNFYPGLKVLGAVLASPQASSQRVAG